MTQMVFGETTNFQNQPLSLRKGIVIIMLRRIMESIEQMEDDSPIANILLQDNAFCIVGGPTGDVLGPDYTVDGKPREQEVANNE